MSILNVDKIQPIGGGSTITVDATYVDILDNIRHVGDTNTAIRFPANDTFSVETAGSERFRIASGGDVTTTGAAFDRANAGITARSGDSFNVTRASGTPLELNRTGSDGALINLFNDGTQKGIIGITGSDMWFGTTAERLRITSAGALRLSDTNSPNDQNTDIWVADDVLNFNAYGTNGAFIFKSGSSSTERLRIDSNGWQSGHTAYQGVGINTFASWARTGGAIRGEVGYNAVTLDYMYFGTGTVHPVALRTNNTTALLVDNNQRVLIGHIATDDRDGYNSALQVSGTGGDDSSISIGRWSGDISSPGLVLSKSRNGTIGSHTVLQANDILGIVQFQGDDGSNYHVGADIRAIVVSGVGNDDMPADLAFRTNGGSTGTTERLRIKSGGDILFTGSSYNMTWRRSPGALRLNNDAQLNFGTNDDGDIYHDSTQMIINNATGTLKVRSNNLQLTRTDNEVHVNCVSGNQVELNHSGNKRLETTSAGIYVTGTVAAKGQITSSAVPPIAIESTVDANDFSISQYEDSNGVYTLLGQNVQLNAGGTDVILDSGHKSSGILLESRNHGGVFFYTGGTNETEERLRIDSSGYLKLLGRNVQGSANGDKLMRIYQPSRTDAEEDILLLQSYNTSTDNSIIIGGGDSSYNAATEVSIRTAAINTTSGTERLKIHSDGMLETRHHGNAKSYSFSSGTSGGYSTCTVTIDCHAYHSFVIHFSQSGYHSEWGTAIYQGYENSGMFYADEGPLDVTDQNSNTITHSYNGSGHVHKIVSTIGGTHPVAELKLTIGGPDAYIDSGDITWTWS